MPARVHDGSTWIDVAQGSGAGNTGNQVPVPPVFDGDGNIFVSIPSFRDGKRCGKTISKLFEKAQNPDKVFIGLVEQNHEDDLFCLEAYCRDLGVEIYRKNSIRKDTTKVIATNQRKDCPRIDQIRKLAVHNVDAKGPTMARTWARKLLGNEEFCLQIDAHMDFAQDWDVKLKHEWEQTGNEFGIISTVPPSLEDKSKDDNGQSDGHVVPRQCAVTFLETGVPSYHARGDGKASNLAKPLLSHGWSSGFSFAKCHLEESAPYDPFQPYVMGVEQFARYARFWTRGYDVYTPTQNLVYHDYQPNEDGYSSGEWMKQRRERIRVQSLKRIRTYLQLPDGDPDLDLNNLGIYGLGKRRTMKQLADFVGIDLGRQKIIRPTECANHHWVPYDTNISPVASLYDNPNDLEPQPEYPLRTNFTFYTEYDEPLPLPILDGIGGEDTSTVGHANQEDIPSPFPPASLLVTLWAFGLIVWYMTFMNSTGVDVTGGGNKMSKTKPRRKKGDGKDV